MMRSKHLRKLSVLVSALFVSVCFFIYANVSPGEHVPSDVLHAVSSINAMGMNSLQMDWLKRVRLPTSVKHPVQISPSSMKTTNSIWNRPSVFNVSTIYEEIEFKNVDGGVWKQGFPIKCPKGEISANPIEVFIVPHSHQDPGWVKTFGDYFRQQTKPCLDATLRTLLTRPEARFTYAEVSFFRAWFDTLTAPEKQQVKQLLHTGRLEIASGGWVMPDEGTAHYHAILDQFVEGHDWLKQNLDYLPNTSWAIDAFGHSSSMAYLVHKMHLRGHVLNRIHYELKKYLASRQSLEFRWRQSWDSTGRTDLPTHMLPFYAYDVPHTCGPNPAVCCQFDFARINKHSCPWKIPPRLITADNVAERAALLADQYCQKSTLFGDTRILLVPLGDDFRYTSTQEWALQLDNYGQLIAYWNAHPEMGIKARFAVLSDYFAALDKASGRSVSLPRLSGDMIVYADRDEDYWTGYFTSRPLDKAMARQLQAELRSAELLYAFASIGDSPSRTLLESMLYEARKTLGLLQHHDAITGTAKPFVVKDNEARRNLALGQVRHVSRFSLVTLLLSESGATLNSRHRPIIARLLEEATNQKSVHSDWPEFVSLQSDVHWSRTALSSDTILDIDDKPKYVLLFNPMTYRRTFITSVVVRTKDPARIQVSQVTASNSPVRTQAVQLSEAGLFQYHMGPLTLEPLSTLSVMLDPAGGQDSNTREHVESPSSASELVFRSESIELHFNKDTGLLERFVNFVTGIHVLINVDFLRYRTQNGKSHSGAYLFVPLPKPEVVPMDRDATKFISRGPLFDQISIRTRLFNHTVRLYKDGRPLAKTIEIENDVNLSEERDFELVMRIRTNIASTWPTFYTDSNCFQFAKRTFHAKLPIQANVYPMTCAAFIEGASSSPHVRLTLLTAYSLGVSSPSSGELLVWLDRRAPKDDLRGLGAPLLGQWTVVSLFRVFIEHIQPSVDSEPTPNLSLLAHFSLLDLAQPVQRYAVDSQLASLSLPARMRAFSFPCDYELVSLRAMANRTWIETSAQSATPEKAFLHFGMWLRRHPPFPQSDLSRDFQDTQKPCEISRGIDASLSVRALFPAPSPVSKAAKPRRITLVPEPGETLEWSDSLLVPTMEVEGFILA